MRIENDGTNPWRDLIELNNGFEPQSLSFRIFKSQKFVKEAAIISSTRTMINTGTTSTCYSYYIYSHDEMTAERFLSLQRKHWAIENNLHWCLDCCFHEDDMHVRMGHAAVNVEG